MRARTSPPDDLRSEGQFNTVVYEEEDLYPRQPRRDVVMMAPADAARLGVADGDRVVVATEVGRLEVSSALVDIRPGKPRDVLSRGERARAAPARRPLEDPCVQVGGGGGCSA